MNLPCKKFDGKIKKVYNNDCTQKEDIPKGNLDIYHCGDVSGEVPPVLIPNTVVKLTSAENTLLATAREDRLLLHPNKKH